jgi:phospholipid-translocating ATPase
MYWFITLVVVISTLVPYFTYTAFERRFFPLYHSLIQWARHEGNYEDPVLNKIPVHRIHVGFTARVEAGVEHFKNKIRHNHNGDRVRGFQNDSH